MRGRPPKPTALKLLQGNPGKRLLKALACYCQAYSRPRKAEAVIAKHGMTFKTRNGFVQKRPEVTIAREAMQLMKAFAAEFGLTPAARTRLQVSVDSTSDKDAHAERFFG